MSSTLPTPPLWRELQAENPPPSDNGDHPCQHCQTRANDHTDPERSSGVVGIAKKIEQIEEHVCLSSIKRIARSDVQRQLPIRVAAHF